MFSVEHASSTAPALIEGRGDQQASYSCLVAKHAVEFPQVLAAWLILHNTLVHL